jgi:hypothetical protein
LVFRAKPRVPSADALAELESAMAAAEMKLPQPGEDAETPAAGAPEQAAALQQAAANAPAPSAVAKREAGPFPDPVLVTPKTLPPAQAKAQQPKFDASHDPLAPLRAMSEAQKIALFS